MFTAWAKVIETSASFLEKAVDAGIQHWKSKFEILLKISKEMMAEIRNKTQACEAMAVAMETKDRRISDLLAENNKLKKLLKEKEQ